jgi:hypothetical protein
MGTQVARWDLDDDAAPASAHAFFTGAMAHARTPPTTIKLYRHTGRLLAGATAAVALSVLTLMWPAISGISFDFPITAQTPAQDKPATALAGTLGPESLPISAPLTRDTSDDVDPDIHHKAIQPTEHNASSDISRVAQPEVVEQ